MLSLEHVQLLETRVAKAIEYVQKVTAENTALSEERAGLEAKLETNKKRLDEMEMLVLRFKEDQGRIEDGVMAALDRLSQFEEAFESSLKDDTGKTAKTAAKKEKPASSPEFFEITEEGEEKAGELDIF